MAGKRHQTSKRHVAKKSNASAVVRRSCQVTLKMDGCDDILTNLCGWMPRGKKWILMQFMAELTLPGYSCTLTNQELLYSLAIIAIIAKSNKHVGCDRGMLSRHHPHVRRTPGIANFSWMDIINTNKTMHPRTPYYPGEDEKLRATNVTRRRGGNCPNTLEVLQQLTSHESTGEELPLALITILPAKSSIASQQIRSAFGSRVNLDHCIYRDGFEEPASCYIIKSQSTGSRTIVNYNDLPEMSMEEFTRTANELGPKATWFHFEVWLAWSSLDVHCLYSCRAEHQR